jgi:hypothetical protein
MRPDKPLARCFPVMALLAAALGGCMTSRVEESRHAATGLANGESVVILAGTHVQGKAIEEKFIDCVSDRLDDGRKAVPVISGRGFSDALFPWFEPRRAPETVEALPELMVRPGVRERIAAHGVRYVVWVSGATERTDGGGGLSCAVGPGGGGCLGLSWWEDDASYDAAIWDLSRLSEVGTVSADVHGTSVVPALIVPLPLIARTRAAACKDLGDRLQQFIAGETAG